MSALFVVEHRGVFTTYILTRIISFSVVKSSAERLKSSSLTFLEAIV